LITKVEPCLFPEGLAAAGVKQRKLSELYYFTPFSFFTYV